MTKYGKVWLTKQIANKAYFSRGDVKIILDAFERVIHEVIDNRDELILNNLFKISVTKIDNFIGYDFKTRKKKEKTFERIKITPSVIMRKVVREGIASTTPIDDEEMEDF
jgi:hypothetical protein